MLKQHRSIIIIVVLVLAAVGLWTFKTQQLKSLPKTGGTQSPPQSIPASTPGTKGSISFLGQIVCLPHKNQSGAQTMECAYGLKAENGVYYSLKDSTTGYKIISSAPMNQPVEVSGSLQLQDNPKYDSIGVITISSVEIL